MRLARKTKEKTGSEVAGEELHKYLCFLCKEKIYAINILRVKELVEHMEVTSLPQMPDFYLGAINLRGCVVPIIDLARRLGLGVSEISRRSCFVIVEIEIDGQKQDAGVVVDGVSEVADIPPENRQRSPDFGGTIRNEYIESIGKVSGKFVVILNIKSVLSMSDLKKLSSTLRAHAEEPERDANTATVAR